MGWKGGDKHNLYIFCSFYWVKNSFEYLDRLVELLKIDIL